MQFNLDTGEGNIIRGYRAHEIKINDALYHDNLILTPTQIISDGVPQTIAELNQNHLAKIVAMKPQIVLIGTGEKPTFLPSTLTNFLLNASIGCEVMTTDAACRTYNVLMSEGRNVLAILFLN